MFIVDWFPLRYQILTANANLPQFFDGALESHLKNKPQAHFGDNYK